MVEFWTAMEESDAAATRLLGVSLAQYAGIQAAVAQGFPLEQALANERLSARKWDRCRAAWTARLAREGQGSPSSAALRDKLAEAARWLGRRVTPLEEDIVAWLSFLGAYAADPAPSALLARLGLRDEDVQRLVLAWKRRTDEDEALARKALEIVRKGPRAVPAVRVTPGKLRPFPWSPGPEEARRTATTKGSNDSSPVTPFDLGTPASDVRVETPSFLLNGLAGAGAAVPAKGASEPRAAREPAADTPIGETVLGFVLPPAAAALPFAPAAERAPLPVSEGPRAPVMQSGETALVFELPKALLPFGPSAQTKRSAPLSTGTLVAPDPPSSPALPFRGSAGPEAIGERVEGTDLSAVVRSVLARRSEPATNEPKPRAAGPDSDARPGFSAAGVPTLTLEQHASLCAEVAFAPDRTAQLLARYGVTSEAKRSLDAHYAGATREKAAWDAAYRTYHAWLSDARRSQGQAQPSDIVGRKKP